MATVMLVDDSPTILASVGQLIRSAGYNVAEASSAEAAMKEFNNGKKFDLIITDFNMPGMNGAELISAARKLPNLRFTPILVLTTESKQSRRDEARQAGATGWIVKPVESTKLIAALKKLLPAG